MGGAKKGEMSHDFKTRTPKGDGNVPRVAPHAEIDV